MNAISDAMSSSSGSSRLGRDAARLGSSLLQILKQVRLWDGTFHCNDIVDHGSRNSVDVVTIREVGELRCFDHVRADQGTRECETVGEANRPGAVWAGGCDEDLKVEGMIEGREPGQSCGREAVLAA